MCGIVGVISATTLAHQQQEHFGKLLVMDQVRGYDSCGIIADKFKGTDFIKSVYDPATFLADKKTLSVMSGARGLVGHNRAATRGSIRVQNAHPFSHGAVTLVHNGTLSYPYLPNANQFDVDSESIAYNLSLVPPEGAVGILEQISGAYALVWRDDRDDSWNICRNDDRPLHVMPLVGGTTMYLSSEVGILYAAVHKEIKVDPTTQIVPLPVGELWKIKSEAGKLVREVIKFSPKKSYSQPQGKAGTVSTTGITITTTPSQVSTSTSQTKETYHDAVESFKRVFRGKLTAGWHKVDIDKEYEGKNGNRHYIGFLSSDPGNEVRIVTTEELSYTEPYEVYITTLWLDSYGNHKCKTMYDYILSSGSVRKIKKEDTIVEDEPLQCINCGGVFKEDEMYHLDDGDSLCQLCYTTDDNESKMYAHHIGIAKRPTVKP